MYTENLPYDLITDITEDRAAMALEYLQSLRISPEALVGYCTALHIVEMTEETKKEIAEDADEAGTEWTVEDEFQAERENALSDSRDFVYDEYSHAGEWLVRMGFMKEEEPEMQILGKPVL